MTDNEKRAHDLAMLMLSHGVNHLGADGQGFDFYRWQMALAGAAEGTDFITDQYWRAYDGFLQSLEKTRK